MRPRKAANLMAVISTAGAVLSSALPAHAQPPDAFVSTVMGLIPMPKSVEAAPGFFQFNASTVIASTTGAAPEAQLLAEQLSPAMGFQLKVQDAATTPPSKNVVRFALDPAAAALGEEGYRLKVESESIDISAFRPAGLFYASQTIRQMLPSAVLGKSTTSSIDWKIPCATIEDTPRFAWRGHLFDVCRHFFTVEEVKRAIDLLALHKVNVLHWHLTEDQGWRIEIKRYPKLTEVGAWRIEKDGKRSGGFYSQDEVRDVIAYATRRHMKVVPEIEMPGHATAALASYAELGCTGGPYKVLGDWGVFKDVYCAGQEQTFQFIYNVLDEVIDLFPSQYIHIGGDECPKDRWTSCTKCQARIKTEGLKNEHELQSYFIRRIDKYLTDRGRRLVGWDEILEGGLAPGAVVQSWRGIKGGIEAANAGHDVIMSPTSHCYLDYSYATTPLEKSYGYEPVPAELAPDKAKHVLGLEGNMWTEWVPDMGKYEFQVYPRMAALAEVGWSQPQGRNWQEFSKRMEHHQQRFRALEVEPGDAEEVTTANAVVVGQWTDSQMKESGVELEWDVTGQIKTAGKYEAIPWYTRGAAALQFEWMALHENGKEVSRDSHLGSSGYDKRDIIYRLDTKKPEPGARYTLKGFAKPIGGTQSFGDVYFRKAKKQIQ